MCVGGGGGKGVRPPPAPPPPSAGLESEKTITFTNNISMVKFCLSNCVVSSSSILVEGMNGCARFSLQSVNFWPILSNQLIF